MLRLGSVMGKPVHKIIEPDQFFVVPEAKIGIEVELENWDGDGINSFWINKPDNSLRNNGQEFVTNGGLVGTDLRKAVTTLCTAARARKYDVGYPRAGIHVHLDVTDLDLDSYQLATLVAHYLLIEHVFFGIVGNWRRDCGYCVPFSASQADFGTLSQLVFFKSAGNRAAVHYASALSKYQALNLECLSRFGTIEFRHLPTTFDAEEILRWINFILTLRKSANITLKEPLDIVRRINLAGSPYEYALEHILGCNLATLARYQPLLDEKECDAAVDLIIELLAFGGNLTSSQDKTLRWSDGKANPLFAAKGNPPKTTKVKKATKTDYDQIMAQHRELTIQMNAEIRRR